MKPDHDSHTGDRSWERRTRKRRPGCQFMRMRCRRGMKDGLKEGVQEIDSEDLDGQWI